MLVLFLVISVMTSVENSEQYDCKADSSRINKVEPRRNSSLCILEVFFRRQFMSVLIENVDKLDANNYDKITIREEMKENAVGVTYVSVEGRTTIFPTVLLPNRFSNILRRGRDEDTIRRIIEYFLQYTKVNSIIGRPMYEDDFVVKGARSLNINIFDLDLSLSIETLVWQKYISDRAQFLEEHDDAKIYEFFVKENTSDYRVDGNISLILDSYGDDVISSECNFFKHFLMEKLLVKGDEAEFLEGYMPNEYGDDIIEMSNWIKCGDLEFRIQDMRLLTLARDVVSTYNSQMNKAKLKQIKLEGF